MYKIRIFAFVLLLLSIVLFSIKQVNADTPIAQCPDGVQTQPLALDSQLNQATFTIPLGKYYDSSVKKWEVAFDCGAVDFLKQTTAAQLVSQSVIATIPRNTNPGAGCEFYAGMHNIIAMGDNTPRCKAQYTVADADVNCKLTLAVSNSISINPPDGIIPSSEVKVSGENLTDKGQFFLYIDNNDLLQNNYVSTPTFSNIKIDNKKLTPGRHNVYLRRKYTLVAPLQSDLGPPICPKEFTVGTPDAPGSVSTSPPGTSATVCTGADCTSGGGKEIPGCGRKDANGNDDPRGSGIATAIGCIHTNPAELVKDLMTFLIGIGGGLAFLMMLFGAFQMLTSAGNPETLNAGRSRLTSAVIGLLFVIFAVLLLQIIGVDILQIPGFKR